MIHIDFQGGAHGNFLEFVCNVAANVEAEGLPFDSMGASHTKKYRSPKVFFAGHYSFDNTPMSGNCVISIKIDINDLLPLSQVSLLRAGNYGYDNDQLEIDTYHKLKIPQYKWVLDILVNGFFKGQIEKSYNLVKDPSWPPVTSMHDFKKLPEHIRNECIEVHHLELLELNEEHPDCPRHILREFFKIGFDDPVNHGFMTQQQSVSYQNHMRVFEFPFNAFYSTEKFLNQIDLIEQWSSITFTNREKIKEIHREFLARQPYKDSKIKCDQIVKQLIQNNIELPRLNLIEEAYVNSELERLGYERRY